MNDEAYQMLLDLLLDVASHAAYQDVWAGGDAPAMQVVAVVDGSSDTQWFGSQTETTRTLYGSTSDGQATLRAVLVWNLSDLAGLSPSVMRSHPRWSSLPDSVIVRIRDDSGLNAHFNVRLVEGSYMEERR